MTKQLLMIPVEALRFYCFLSLLFISLILLVFFIILLLRIYEITYLLTPYSVDELVSFSNHKINDLLPFMERLDHSLFVHVTNLC